MLGITPGVYNEMLLAIATDELRKINQSRTPAEKAACVVGAAHGTAEYVYCHMRDLWFVCIVCGWCFVA